MNRERMIIEAGAGGLRRLFQAGKATPSEVTDLYLRRIRAFNPHINAFLEVLEAEAHAAAAASDLRWRKGAPVSPLDGVPVGIKANIAVKGAPWHAGIGAYRDRVALQDAEAVRRLRAAGAVILGTLNMHEAALGATTDNPHFGRCHNPRRNGFTPGGSSGGSGAAVAGGLAAAALGTDTMGSVRIPSAYCGCAGLKATYGAVPTAGVIELSWTLDHVGPHARDVEGLARLFEVLAGHDMTLPEIKGMRFGALAAEEIAELTPAVSSAYERSVRAIASDFRVRPMRLPDYDAARMMREGLLISEAEGSIVHEARLAEDPDGFSRELRALFGWGANQTAARLAKAHRAIRDFTERFDAVLEDVDVLMMPVAPQNAFAFDAPVPLQALFTAIANFAGVPALAVPAGFDDGLPCAVQFLARRGREDLVLAAGLHFERLMGGPMPISALQE